MGGGSYDRDVYGSDSDGGFDYSGYSGAAESAMGSKKLDSGLVPQDRILVTEHENPIVVALDVTGSMGDWSKIIYDKMPMFYGQIIMQGYLQDPAVSFAAVGDATCDNAPIQICDFEQGTALDSWLTRIFLEGGGGGQDTESYELTAYFYARKCVLKNAKLPFFFVIGDERFYPRVSAAQIKEWIGAGSGVDSNKIWKELIDKFNVFLIHKTYGSNDDEVLKQWKSALGGERVIVLNDPRAVVDVMLGAIALVSESRSLNQYLVDMKGRDQTADRIRAVKKALLPLGTSGVLAKSAGRLAKGKSVRITPSDKKVATRAAKPAAATKTAKPGKSVRIAPSGKKVATKTAKPVKKAAKPAAKSSKPVKKAAAKAAKPAAKSSKPIKKAATTAGKPTVAAPAGKTAKTAGKTLAKTAKVVRKKTTRRL